jgi:protein-disulfide isomerase
MVLLRLLLALGLTLMMLNGPAWADCNADQVIAKVGNQTLTEGQLQAGAAGKLLNQQYSYYLAEQGALDQLIDQMLLTQAAQREHVSVPQLLEEHLKDKVKEPSEDALHAFYEGMETQQPYSELRPQILQHLRQLRAQRARDAYIDQLKAQTTIVTMLAPPSAMVALGKAPIRGPQNAPVTLVEFADYECPYCRQINPELQKLERQYHGQLRLAYKDLPLPMHPHAEKAAEAARCAGQQGKFWPYHDRLFTDPNLDVPHLKQLAGSLGLDSKRFDQCLDSGSQAAMVSADASQGKALGLSGTPSFFINGHFISGAVSYDVLSSLVAQQLANSGGGRNADTTAGGM